MSMQAFLLYTKKFINFYYCSFSRSSHPYLKVLLSVAGTSFGRPEGLLSVAVRTSSKEQKSANTIALYIFEYV